jgi:hypothetical protein
MLRLIRRATQCDQAYFVLRLSAYTNLTSYNSMCFMTLQAAPTI